MSVKPWKSQLINGFSGQFNHNYAAWPQFKSSMLLKKTFAITPFTMVLARSKYTLPDLPYDYNALEPVISAEIMQIHHQKHHQAYINNLNLALEKMEAAESKQDLQALVTLQQQIKFNGGGNLNHSIFWKNLCPPNKAKGKPSGNALFS